MPSAEVWNQFPMLAVAVLLAAAILWMQERRDEKQNTFNERMSKIRDEASERQARIYSDALAKLTEALSDMERRQAEHNELSRSFTAEMRAALPVVIPGQKNRTHPRVEKSE